VVAVVVLSRPGDRPIGTTVRSSVRLDHQVTALLA
jgi:hypothetical protein